MEHVGNNSMMICGLSIFYSKENDWCGIKHDITLSSKSKARWYVKQGGIHHEMQWDEMQNESW